MGFSHRDRMSRPLIMGALAFAAVVASHNFAYRLAAPDPHYRAELLHSTGHRYFTYIAALALGLLVVALTAFLRTGTSVRTGGRARFAYAAPRLLALQIGGFLSLEFAERAIFGHGSGGFLTEEPVVIGLLLQLLVALIGAASLCLIAYVVKRVRGALPRLARSFDRLLVPRLEPLPLRALVEAGAADPRGPPAL